MLIEIVTHYKKENLECIGDYYAVDVIVDGNVVDEDSYIEAKEINAYSIYTSWLECSPTIKVTHIQIADREH
jgi:hypothetical protein